LFVGDQAERIRKNRNVAFGKLEVDKGVASGRCAARQRAGGRFIEPRSERHGRRINVDIIKPL
jgi:hypothetical protein